MVPPGFSSPEASAASIIRAAMRSFTEPPGLRYSTFARTSGDDTDASGRSRVVDSRTSGVLPTRSSSDSAYSMAVKIAADNGDAGIRDRVLGRPPPPVPHRGGRALATTGGPSHVAWLGQCAQAV